MTDTANKLGAHAPMLTPMIEIINEKAVVHNGLIAQLSIKADGDNSEALNAIREQNPENDPQIEKNNKLIAQMQEKLAQLTESTNVLAQKFLPKPLNEEEKVKVQSQVKDLQGEYRKMLAGLEQFAGAFDLKDAVGEMVQSLNHLSGKKSGGTSDGRGAGIPKIRTKEVYVNGDLIQVAKPGKEGEFSSTISGAAVKISSTTKNKVAAADIQTSYFAAAGVEPSELDKLPNDITFDFPAKVGDTEIKFAIRVVRA